MILVLFDIDGTILTSQGIGRKAVTEALSSVCQVDVSSDGIPFSGRTDPVIMRDMLSAAGLSVEKIDSVFDLCLSAYTSALTQRLTPDLITVLPGVSSMIRNLHERDDVTLALLTGNLKETAYLKLHAAGLASFFEFGAFGSDREDRYLLPEIAIDRALRATGISFSAGQTIIIGDTPHDIGCSNAYGSWSIGVCTGFHDRIELAQHDPDILLDDLSNPGPVYDLISRINDS